jgi:tetratricopeptide (TPR) repeat protein
VIAELELHISREDKYNRFKVETTSSLGTAESSFVIDPSTLSTIRRLHKDIENQTELDEQALQDLGTQLFQMLFSHGKELLRDCMNQAEHTLIVLHLEDPLLDTIPWELCYDSEKFIWLGAHPHCSLIRRDQKTDSQFELIDYPLRVLIIISSPMDLEEKGEYQPDPDEIERLMDSTKPLQEKGKLQIDFLDRASISCIQDSLRKGYHIVHFIGHGSYDPEKKIGSLVIEDKNRNSKRIKGNEIAQLFGIKPPRLMILTACESSPAIPFLLSGKVPAVMGMQYTVLKDVAHQFVERFYAGLTAGEPVFQAVSNARNAVLLEEGKARPGWFTPVVYMRSDTVLEVNTDSPVRKPQPKPERHDMDKDLIGVENFVGRRRDLWAVEKGLFEDNLKLGLVTGIGGIGKTALAWKFVKRHRDEFKGVFARKIMDPSMKAEELLGLLDRFLVVNGDDRLHAVVSEPDLNLKLEVLASCLKDGYLIVLDNFETLILDSRIPEEWETVLKTFLSGDHSSKVLITSRYGFAFRDEKGSGQIKTTDLNELRFQAVRELLERQRITDFDQQKKIYGKVGGNPQFLEFFVQLSKEKSVEWILQDITPVREKIGEWLLNELVGMLRDEEKAVLKEISVFRSEVNDAVFQVLKTSDKVIGRLVYLSLIKFDEAYSMHPSVREYVGGMLSEDERKRAHLKAVQCYELLLRKEKGDLLDILELHYHLVECGQLEEAGNLVLGLTEPLSRWGLWEKLIELLVKTISTTEDSTKAGGLHNLGYVLQSLGDYEQAEKLYTESLEILKSLGDRAGIAISLGQLGILQQKWGNYEQAEKLYTESLEIKKSLGDRAGIARSLHQLGILQEEWGNYEQAEKLYTESLEIAKSLGDRAGIAISLHQLGRLQEEWGNYEQAEKLYTESLEIAKSLGDRAGIAISLHQLGILQEEWGNYENATQHYISSLSTFLEIKSPNAETVIRSLQRTRQKMSEAKFDEYWKIITNQEVPDFIKESPSLNLEDLIHYVKELVKTHNSEQINQITQQLSKLIQEVKPSELTPFFQILLDYLSGKKIKEKAETLPEPLRSLIQPLLEETT